MANLIQTLLRKRAATSAKDETSTTVVPISDADDTDKKKKDDDEPGMADGDGDETCPDCGNPPDECSCGKAEDKADDDDKTDEDDGTSGSSSAVTHPYTRSGDRNMGTNDKSAASNTLPALADFRAVKSFGADAAFCVECVEKQRTLLQAHEAWAEKQSQALAAANATIAGAKKLGDQGVGGTDPLRGTGAGGAGGAGTTAGALGLGLMPAKASASFNSFEEGVEHYMSKNGRNLSRFKAIREMAVNHPALHADWLARSAAIYQQERSQASLGITV